MGLVFAQETKPVSSSLKNNVSEPGDWPHYNGPNYDASSGETGLLKEWPKDGPKVLWKVKSGKGVGCPSIAGNDLVLCQFDEGIESVRCLDAKTGTEKWKCAYKPWKNYWNWGWHWLGFKSTPTITDKHMFAIGLMGELHCLDRKDGKVIWTRNIAKDWNGVGMRGEKGYSISPVVAGNKVIIFMDNPKGKIDLVAMDAETGKDAWIYCRDNKDDTGGAEGQTPLITEFNKETCVVFQTEALHVVRVADGKLVWTDNSKAKGRFRGISTPLFVGNIVVMMGDFEPARATEIDRNTSGTAKRLWSLEFPYSIYHNFVHDKGYIYGLFPRLDKDDTVIELKDWDVRMYCLDLKSGQKKWEQAGFKSGYSQMVADGMIYVRESNNLRLIEATPAGFKEKDKIENMHAVSNKDMSDCACVMPVLSRGRLYVRNPDELWCLDVKDAKAK